MPHAAEMRNNPVHKRKDGWYFYDETWANATGPYTTEEGATSAMKSYADMLDAHEDDMRRYWSPA